MFRLYSSDEEETCGVKIANLFLDKMVLNFGSLSKTSSPAAKIFLFLRKKSKYFSLIIPPLEVFIIIEFFHI